MRLKYYLRGLGIGLVTTTIILTVSNKIRFANAQLKQNTEQNETTGSVIAFTTAAQTQAETETAETTAAPVTESTTIQTPATEPVTEKTAAAGTEAAETGKATVTIKDVYYASQAADLLVEAGVIKDRGEFIQYMQNSGYATR